LPVPKHTILFLAANPIVTAQLALGREARAIQHELERSGFRDRFELVTRWAVEPLDLLRELRKLKPTVVHFSGHGGHIVGRHGAAGHAAGGHVDAGAAPSTSAQEPHRHIEGAAADAAAVGEHTDERQHGLYFQGVIGMRGAIRYAAARSFAIGFYGGLGERESIAAAHAQGRAAISLEGLPDSALPQLRVRRGVDAGRLVLAADPL
jgi:hypothetical protein